MNLPESCNKCIYYEFSIDCCYCSTNPNHDESECFDIKDRFKPKARRRSSIENQ